PVPVQVDAVPGDHVDRADLLALRDAEIGALGPAEPDVDIEPDLVRTMTAVHRPAPRLADVADIETGPAELARTDREPLDEGDHLGVAPVAVARKAHRLPARCGFGQQGSAGQAAARIAAEGGGSGRGERPVLGA